MIIGLGNMGAEYAGTRHNVGFEVIEELAQRLSVDPGPGKGPFYVAEGRHKGQKVVLIEPTTFMNRSGLAVRKALGLYGELPQQGLVCYDDLNLPVGRIRLRPGGSAGGHNGMSDIIRELGTDQFPRLRVGIGNEFKRGRQVDYVLSPFDNEQRKVMDEVVQTAAEAALCFVREGIEQAMNRYN